MAEAEVAESLRDTLDAAIEEVETPIEEPVPSEPAPAEAAPVEKTTEPTEAKPEEVVDEVPILGEKTAERPPASWKGDAKKVWAELPEAARSEVIRRERQVENTLRETAQTRQFADQFIEVANAYEGRLKTWGVQPAQAFRALMDADRMLTSGDAVSRAQSMAKLIKDYNIDIAALDSALASQPIQPSGQQNINEQVKQLLAQELAPFKQRMAAEQQAQQQEVAHSIESMQQDHVNFPYFEDVRDDMADLIEIKAQRGIYISLPEAYNIAIGMNPAVTGAQQASQQRTQAIKAHEVAQKAKGAAVSVGGSPATTSGGPDPTNLRASIADAIDNLRA